MAGALGFLPGRHPVSEVLGLEFGQGPPGNTGPGFARPGRRLQLLQPDPGQVAIAPGALEGAAGPLQGVVVHQVGPG